MTSIISSGVKYVNRFIDQTGMYRMVTLALSILSGLTIVFGFLDLIPFTGLEQIISLAVALAVALAVNRVCAKLWNITANHESAIITALIIFFLVIPAELTALLDQWIIAAVTFIAIISKYILAWRGQHILNPAAAGGVGLALVYGAAEFFDITLSPNFFETVWWIGTPILFIPLVIAGAFVVTKVRKWPAVLAFILVGFVVYMIEDWRFGADPFTTYERFILAGPSLFLAFFMLTEPFTSPPTKRLQIGYAVFVAVLANVAFLAPFIKMTPELALVIGNIAFWPSTLRRKLVVPLQSVRELADQTYEYAFTKPVDLRFQAGQYLEWMLPHETSDSRGIRRYFTIASSPTESVLRLALRVMPSGGSSYKAKLQALQPGETIVASQLAGEFLLPKDSEVKLGMIAGGIGITPFRSHIQFMADTRKSHDTVLFYCNNTRADIAYGDEFTTVGATIPLVVVHVIAKEPVETPYETGFVDVAMLKRRAPDYLDRRWYLSGPPGMVNAYETMLQKAGVPAAQIVTDFFPGLA